MRKMTDLTEIRNEMDKAAELMATKPIQQWGEWVLYLLGVLDSRAQANNQRDVYTQMLVAIRDETTARLERRLW
jgi:hypothetical protein